MSEAEAEYIIQIVNKLVKEDLTQEINYQTLVYTTIGSLSYHEDLSDIPYENIVKAYVPYILFENTPYKVYYTDMWGYTSKDYLIAKKETSLKEIFKAMKADFEEQGEELSKKDFEDHVFTVDKNANYVNVKVD